MKILHVIDSEGLYGAEIVLLNLVEEQIKLGLNPVIVSIGSRGIVEKKLESEAEKREFPVKKFRMTPGPNIWGAIKILQFAKKENFDLIHSHGYKGNILFGFIPKKFRKIPLVATLHGWTGTRMFAKIRFYEWVDSKSLYFIDAAIAVSQKMISHRRLKNRKRINLYVVNNGIPVERSNPKQYEQQTGKELNSDILDFSKKGFTVGSIGRLSEEKGYRYLIEAIAVLVRKEIDIRLIIIGEGKNRQSLENLVSNLDIKNRVLLAGYELQARRYLQFFNLFVIPSLTEGMPITLLEAMASKTPVVATDVGDIPEILDNGNAGLLIKPRDTMMLGETICDVFHNRKKSAMLAESAFKRVTAKYDSIKMAYGYLKIYNDLAKSG
jgi:glycosyltransferase involved in cell wall biosynthesis